MNHDKCTKHNPNRFICSICLNKPKNSVKPSAKLCPFCSITFDDGVSETSKEAGKTKWVQTSETDITHGITLLNEVLNVFQSKKLGANNKLDVKDSAVNTDRKRLVMSEIFHYSIGATKINGDEKFTIINYEPHRVPESISLRKHKSSSIPQMKLEELKHLVKEKTKSKDAIEEVNRMFANVKKFNLDSDANRPLIRNGPRILPVVKTDNACERTQCCQDYQMSSGDSGLQGYKTQKCAECFYMRCHYQCEKCIKRKS